MARSPEWSPLADIEASTWVEAVEVASKNRVLLPTVLRRRLGWAFAKSTVTLLATIEPDGSAELVPWDGVGEAVIARAADAIERASTDDRTALAIAAADRYLRLGLEPDGRATLPFNLAVHLGTLVDPLVRTVATGGRLWLWNEREWQVSRQSRFAPLMTAVSKVV